ETRCLMTSRAPALDGRGETVTVGAGVASAHRDAASRWPQRLMRGSDLARRECLTMREERRQRKYADNQAPPDEIRFPPRLAQVKRGHPIGKRFSDPLFSFRVEQRLF